MKIDSCQEYNKLSISFCNYQVSFAHALYNVMPNLKDSMVKEKMVC